jgi:hypothetical protein
MKTLSLDQLEKIQGGNDALDFADGFCTGVAVYALFGGPVGWALGGGCTIYGVVRLATS